jgi:hypothetical protein
MQDDEKKQQKNIKKVADLKKKNYFWCLLLTL